MTKFITFANHLIAIPKTQYILQNIINVGNNTLVVPQPFRYRANDYKSTHRKFKNKKQVPKETFKQKIFHEHFSSDDHNGIQNWVITLIEQVDNEKFLRQKDLFWAHKLDTFYPNGLNQREIYATY